MKCFSHNHTFYKKGEFEKDNYINEPDYSAAA